MIIERAGSRRGVGWTGLLGALLVPVLVVAGFLWATWHAEERLHLVRAAIVNLDEPVTVQGQLVPLGRQLAGGLAAGEDDRDNITWVLNDAEGAAQGLRNGQYVAVVTIPEGFSAAATSYGGSASAATQATIDVRTSQQNGVVDPVLVQAVTGAATDALNRTLTERYLDNVYVGLNDVKKNLGDLADGTSQLADGAGGLSGGVDQAALGAHQLANGMSTLDSGGAELSGGASALAGGAGQLAVGARALSGGLNTLDSQLAAAAKAQADTSQLTRLADGSGQIRTGAAGLADGTAQLSGGTAAFHEGLLQYDQGLQQLAADGLRDPRTGEPICPAPIAQLGPTHCAAFLEGTRAGAGAAAAGLEQPPRENTPSLLQASGALTAGTAQTSAGARQLADGAAAVDPGVQRLVTTVQALPAQQKQLADGVHQLASGGAQLADGAQGLATGAGQLSSGVSQYTAGVGQASGGTRSLADGLDQLNAGAQQLAEGSGELSSGLAKGADKAPTYSQEDRNRLTRVVARPVASAETPSAPSINAPTLLMALALWLGALATYVVIRAIPSSTLTSARSSAQLALRSFAPGLLLALGQAAAVVGIGQLVLDLPGEVVGRALALALLAGAAFAAVNHALVAWFGGLGRVVSVAVAVLGAAGSLVSATPAAFASIRPVLPLSPAVDGLRAIVLGVDGAGHAAAVLAVWLIGSLLASALAVVRRRTITPEALLARFA